MSPDSRSASLWKRHSLSSSAGRTTWSVSHLTAVEYEEDLVALGLAEGPVGHEEWSNPGLDAEFLGHFAFAGLARGLAGLDVATEDVPPVLADIGSDTQIW